MFFDPKQLIISRPANSDNFANSQEIPPIPDKKLAKLAKFAKLAGSNERLNKNTAPVFCPNNKGVSLLQALTPMTKNLAIESATILDALAPEDINAWHAGDVSLEMLSAFVLSFVQQQEMLKGRVPTDYNVAASCKNCGPVWLWSAGEVLGCPWCQSKPKGKPMPRPTAINCNDCEHLNNCIKVNKSTHQKHNQNNDCRQYTPIN